MADTYRHLHIGLADASIVVLSRRRLSDRDVLTVDERHFRVIAGDHALRLWPAEI